MLAQAQAQAQAQALCRERQGGETRQDQAAKGQNKVWEVSEEGRKANTVEA